MRLVTATLPYTVLANMALLTFFASAGAANDDRHITSRSWAVEARQVLYMLHMLRG
jgi:hypothetical protein